MKNTFALIFIVFLTNEVVGQGVKPGVMYQSGEPLVGPLFGVRSQVPTGWSGVLPMDSEVFLLVPDGINADGEIYVAADTANFEELKERWLTGLSLDNGNTIKSDGDIFMRNDAMASNVILEGNGASAFKAYVEAKCGEYGTCITFLLTSPPQHFEKLKPGLIELSDNTTLVEPSTHSAYDDFDWHEFLVGKYVANFDYVPHAKSENELWLCPDGSFKSKIKRTGLLKDDIREYQGKKSGTWSTSSVGKTGTLTIAVKKMQPVQLDLLIDHDRIYINGKRYFAMLTDECK